MSEMQVLLCVVGAGALVVNVRTFARDVRTNERDGRGVSIPALWVSPLPESRLTSGASLLVALIAFGIVGLSL